MLFYLRNISLILISFLLSFDLLYAQKVELAKTKKGTEEQIIAHYGYTTSYNQIWCEPNWVAWELTREEANGTFPRRGAFGPDPDVKGMTALTYDYSGSGWDRGHMAPAGDMKWSEQAMYESFYLSNICPQSKPLNNGLWKDLEERSRGWAKFHGGVYICCGPIMDKTFQTIGENAVAIPKAFFKVCCIKKGNFYHAVGFIFPNENCSGKIWDYACTVDEVEKATGHDFFYSLPDNIENAMEATWNQKFWKSN